MRFVPISVGVSYVSSMDWLTELSHKLMSNPARRHKVEKHHPYTQAHDPEKISGATMITHHTVYEKTRSLQRSACLSMGNTLLTGGSAISSCEQTPPFEPLLSKSVLPLITAAYGPNGAIALTKIFNGILSDVCNRRYFGVQKEKNGDREIILNTAT